MLYPFRLKVTEFFQKLLLRRDYRLTATALRAPFAKCLEAWSTVHATYAREGLRRKRQQRPKRGTILDLLQEIVEEETSIDPLQGALDLLRKMMAEEYSNLTEAAEAAMKRGATQNLL
jgi:hypothetical protein